MALCVLPNFLTHSLFQNDNERVREKLGKKHKFQVNKVGDKSAISCEIMCSHTKCTFEFVLFKFIGPPPDVPEEERPQALEPSSSAGNIALIIPSQMLPELDKEKVQKFLDGNAAIQLQARVPGNPIQFILQSPRGN